MISSTMLPTRLPQRQSGVVLIIGLVMVLLISIIALASIRGSGLQESMAGNMRERARSFQNSEGALSEGEDRVNFMKGAPPICDGVVRNGFRCFVNLDSSPANSAQYYDQTGFTAKGNATTLQLNGGIAPSYVLEEVVTYQPNDGSGMDEGSSNPFKVTSYRVTSIGNGMSSDANVIIQSTYNRSAH